MDQTETTMSDPLAPELNPNDQIQFVASHRVGLEAGDYTLDIAQQVTIDGKAPSPVPPEDKTPGTFKHTGQKFSVLGERFQLQPQQIHATFPPPGSRGNFWRDLPHVILERSTLPWERTALRGDADADTAPAWLALLVFHADEVPMPKKAPSGELVGRVVVKVQDLFAQVKGPDYYWPGLLKRDEQEDPPDDTKLGRMEYGQHDDDQLTVIDVPCNLLTAQLPNLDYQTHCRRRLAFLPVPADKVTAINAIADDLPSGDGSKSIAQCPRIIAAFTAVGVSLSDHATIEPGTDKWVLHDLPNRQEYQIWKSAEADGSQYAFYRVALEKAVVLANRLPMPGQRNVVHLVSVEGRFTDSESSFTFDAQHAGDTDLIRMVSLYNWEFFCEDPEKDFKGLLEHLNGAQEAETPSTFRLPVPPAAQGQDGEKFLHAGFVPLVHRFRQGDRSVSWYHGPLVPGELEGLALGNADDQGGQPGFTLPASAADKLLIYDSGHGMFDVSYAAAWELGRMLMLQNTGVALKLYHWKRDHQHSLYSARHLADYGYELPVAILGGDTDPSLPAAVDQWLNDVTLLRHVPFTYLVPDPRLLPLESLRFFTVDRAWLECLRDGAFSIGRVLSSDGKQDSQPLQQLPTIPTLSGFLLRSEVVSGFWPSLRIKGYSKTVPLLDAPGENDRKISNLQDANDKELSAPYPTLTLLRMERLSKHVMIALFEGDLQMVDFHLKPEMLHFGFDEVSKIPSDFDPAKAGWKDQLVKNLRDKDGNETGSQLNGITISDARIVDMTDLAQRIQQGIPNQDTPWSPAVFALQMIAGVDLVRFCRR